METETITGSEFPDMGKVIVEQIVASDKKKNNLKEQDCESHSRGFE